MPARFGLGSADFGATSTEIGRSAPTLGRSRPDLARKHFGPTSTNLGWFRRIPQQVFTSVAPAQGVSAEPARKGVPEEALRSVHSGRSSGRALQRVDGNSEGVARNRTGVGLAALGFERTSILRACLGSRLCEATSGQLQGGPPSDPRLSPQMYPSLPRTPRGAACSKRFQPQTPIGVSVCAAGAAPPIARARHAGAALCCCTGRLVK